MIVGINHKLTEIKFEEDLTLQELMDELRYEGDIIEMLKDRKGKNVLFGCRDIDKAVWWEI